MPTLIKIVYPLGVLWSSIWSLLGLVLMLTVYFPRSWPRWNRGALEVVVRWQLIPKGFDATGDGKVDDPKDWYTRGQTHGVIKFFSDEDQQRTLHLSYHEQVHVWQSMIFGPLYGVLYGLDFLTKMLWYRDVKKAYLSILFERWAFRWQADFEAGKRRW